MGNRVSRTNAPAALALHRHRRWGAAAGLALIAVVAARPLAAQSCVGDCNADGVVAISDLILGVNIALGMQPVADCEAFATPEGTVTIAQLIQGVNNALAGCPATPTPTTGGSTVTLSGSCAAPVGGAPDLRPCDPGTPIAVLRCDDPSQCLHAQGLPTVGATTVADNGDWSVQVAMSDASATLIFQASITDAVIYRVLDFGTVGGALRAGRTRGQSVAPLLISPISEATTQLLDMNGLENYSAAGAQQVSAAVEQATAGLSFADVTPDMAIALAVQTASNDPTVIMVLQSARNTPTPSQTPTDTPTATETATPTVGRFVDNADGTISDRQTGLMWEKKVGLNAGADTGNLHAADNSYSWGGLCSMTEAPCEPNPTAADACFQGAQLTTDSCAECPAADGPCIEIAAMGTIWDWVSQLNAGAGFAGHSDWRIPTVAELVTIADYDKIRGEPGDGVDAAFFGAQCGSACLDLTRAACSCNRATSHWTATRKNDLPNFQAWSVWLGSYVQVDALSSPLPVRAVRGHAPPPPTPRSSDNGDGTVIDGLTGLNWEKKVALDGTSDLANLHDADNSYASYGLCTGNNKHCQPTDEASSACVAGVTDPGNCGVCIAAQDGSCNLTDTIWTWILSLNGANFAGHSDWRIPTVQELLSLVDYTSPFVIDPAFLGANCGSTCTDVTLPECGCTVAGPYLTASPFDDYVSFSDGAQGIAAATPYARAVRGGR